MNKRVGVLGGTFDPVHKGHLAIARSFLESGYIDSLWIVPAASPPHKNGDEVTSFTDRKAMLDLVFGRMDDVLINTIEERLPKPSYTLQTIQALKAEYPDYIFFLCIGSDSLVSFDQWYHYKEILDECTLLVAKRPGFHANTIEPEILVRTEFIPHDPIQVSSSDLKEKMAGSKLPEEDLPEAVVQYIREKKLYER